MKDSLAIKVVAIIVLVTIVVAVPFLAPNLYLLGVATTMLTSVLLAVSLWFILSTGQVTLGHAGFAAIGGYICAALVTAYGFSWWVSMPIGIAAAAIVAVVVGYVTLRIKGVYFIVTTLALGEVIRIVFSMIDDPFGGLVGILNVPPPSPIAIPGLIEIGFSTKPTLYYLTLVLVAICLLIMYRIRASHMGLVFRGIMQADGLAEHVGVDIMWYKVLAFTVGSACAGLAGILITASAGSIMPTSFTLSQSVFYLVYVAVGGPGSIVGPVLGAIVISVLAEALRPIIEYEPIVFAMLLIVATLYFKGGLWGLVLAAQDRIGGVLGRGRPAAVAEKTAAQERQPADATE